MEKRHNIKISIIEDENNFNHLLTKYVCAICESLQYNGFSFEIRSYPGASQCFRELDQDTDFMILDYCFGNAGNPGTMTGEQVIETVTKNCPDCKIVVVSALKNSNEARQLMEMGIYDYVDKNANSSNRIGSILQEAIHNRLQSDWYKKTNTEIIT